MSRHLWNGEFGPEYFAETDEDKKQNMLMNWRREGRRLLNSYEEDDDFYYEDRSELRDLAPELTNWDRDGHMDF